jgi:glutamate synthase (ferredoxin)
MVVLETDGGIRTGRDVLVAALLGAERFGFGTLPLLAMGCKMTRRCHLNTCPVGIATQREDLRAKFSGGADQVVMLFRHVAEEVRQHLAALGVRTIEEIVGRADLLRPIDAEHPLAADLLAILVASQGRKEHSGYQPIPLSSLATRLAIDAGEAITHGASVRLAYPIRNIDRTIGARLSGAITAEHGRDGLPEGTVDVKLAGTAGQSLGAWLSSGVTLRLKGVANDYVGKGMGGGVLSVSPVRQVDGPTPHVAGNAVLYGATGGRVFLAGSVGQRFAVRNSGATAVVEGCSDHGCEYMTGGAVLILGDVGRNFGAGMTGGIAYVWDPEVKLKGRIAETAPDARRPTDRDAADITLLMEEHIEYTASPTARSLLSRFPETLESLWVIAASGKERIPPTERMRPSSVRIV